MLLLLENRLEGYYGEFATQSATGAKTNAALFLDVGDDFTFAYDTNQDVITATAVPDQTDKSAVIQKLFSAFYSDPWADRSNPSRGRRLQDTGATNSKKLFNPVLCIQEGDAIFFNVNSTLG